MLRRGDERAVSVQIGAALLLAILVISLSMYQVNAIPEDNHGVEANHNQELKEQLLDVRSSIVSTPGGGSGESTAVSLGTAYPSRSLFVNPPNPTGTLRTVGTDDDSFNVTIGNATGTDDHVSDYWNGSDRSFGTGALVYEPDYNQYQGAPATVYEHSVLYDHYADRGTSVALSEQRVVDGKRISLVTLDGQLSTNRRSYSLDTRPVSTSTNRVAVTNTSESESLTFSFPSRLSEAKWSELLEDEMNGDGHVEQVSATPVRHDGEQYYLVTVELEPGVTYDLQMSRVGVGSNVRSELDPAYLTVVGGDDATITEGDDHEVVVEVRDDHNNPVSGVSVNASTDRGSLEPTEGTTDSDGQVTFKYTAPEDVSNEETVEIDASYSVDPETESFDSSAPENVTATVTVREGGSGGGGTGAYTIDWQDPDADNPSAPLSDCTTSSCTWDVGKDSDDTLTLRSATDPSLEGVAVDFAVDDSSVGTLSPDSDTTNADGEAVTELTASENGTVRVFVATGGSSDVIDLSVTNVTDSSGSSGAYFAVGGFQSTDEAQRGETITTDATIENTGDVTETKFVEYVFDGNVVDDQSVELAPGEATTVEFTYTIPETTTPGERSHEIRTEDDGDGSTIWVIGVSFAGGETSFDRTGDGTSASIAFDVSNDYGNDVTLTGITVEDTTTNAEFVSYEDTDRDEVLVDVSGDRRADSSASGRFDVGESIALDSEVVLSPDTNGRYNVGEFRRMTGWRSRPVDMSAEDVTITIHYEDENGTARTSTFTIRNLP